MINYLNNLNRQDFNGEDVDAIISSLLDDSQEIPELCLFDESGEWGDHKTNTSTGEESKPQTQSQPVEKTVEPSPLSKVGLEYPRGLFSAYWTDLM